MGGGMSGGRQGRSGAAQADGAADAQPQTDAAQADAQTAAQPAGWLERAKSSLHAWLYEGVSTAEEPTGSLVRVETGLQNDDYAQILSGVSEGDVVLYTASSTSSSSSGFSSGGRGGNMGGGMMGFGF